MVMELGDKTALEKIEAAKEHNIRFVQLQFTDILGIVKSVTIPLHQLEGSRQARHLVRRQLDRGLRPHRRERPVPRPDMDTFAEIPWQPGHGTLGAGPLGSRGTARVICDVLHARTASRSPATRAASSSASSSGPTKLGYIWNTGPELEFFLFRQGRGRRASKPLPHDEAGYFDFSTDLAPKSARTWSTPWRPSASRSRPPTTRSPPASTRSTSSTPTALRTADNAVTFKFTLKAIAAAARPVRHVHAQADLRHQRLGHAHPPEPVRHQARSATRSPIADNKYGLSDAGAQLHGRHPGARPRHDRGPGAAGELVQAAGARLRGAGPT